LYKLIILFATAVIFCCGCSVSKKTRRELSSALQIDSKKVLKLAEKQNITNGSFFIEKGKISTSGDEGKISLLFTMKYSQPGKYLISLKSITGIEAFRIYLTEDTVLINDRINKVTLYGEPFDFEKISGVPAPLLKIILGDVFINDENKVIPEQCIDNRMNVNDYYKGLTIKSIINCKLGKINEVTLSSETPVEVINIFYSKYKQDNFKIPGHIEVNDFRKKVKIIIKIEKYSIPWPGEIEFIPGTGYKKQRLL
jgi:hypothetical protein